MPLNSLGLYKKPQNTRVVVAMSGGVDSSVAAGILKKEGYDVIGITLHLYAQDKFQYNSKSCCIGKDIEDARKVCEILRIPHYVLDYTKKFKKYVIDPFVAGYLNGETPIPCIMCNQSIKFTYLLKIALQLEADILATGHYIQSISDNNGNRFLYRPVDIEKDQTYFLFSITKNQIKYLRFPIGGLLKKNVRNLAKKMHLLVSDKKESQDICFVSNGHYSDIILKKMDHSINYSGDILDTNGQILGKHNGIFNFTIGQRRGLGISSNKPLYVIDLNKKESKVIVGSYEELKIKNIYLRDINWLVDNNINYAKGLNIAIKIRSQQSPIPAILYSDQENFWVTLPKAFSKIAPGQACVFYENDDNGAKILGGGFVSNKR